MELDLNKLNLTKGNPRQWTEDNSAKLDRNMDEFGPLDGIVYNVNPKLNELVSGNWRLTKLRGHLEGHAKILHRFEEPTKQGTIAYGYIEVEGERWPYREVWWDEVKHKKGVLLANQNAGLNDEQSYSQWLVDLVGLDETALDDMLNIEDDIKELSTFADEPPDEGKSKVLKYTTEELRNRAGQYGAHQVVFDFLDWLEPKDEAPRG